MDSVIYVVYSLLVMPLHQRCRGCWDPSVCPFVCLFVRPFVPCR